MRRVYASVLVALLWSSGAVADDIDARTMGAVSDLLAPVAAASPPAGVNPGVYAKAVEALKKAGLAGVPRPPQPGDDTLLKAYGKALLLGPRAPQFADRIGKINDAAIAGDSAAVGKAIAELYTAAGRAAPKGKALEDLTNAAMQVVGGEPVPTVNRTLKGDGYQIEIADAVAAGKTSVEVTLADGGDGNPARVLFEGDAVTRPTQDGRLERRVTPADPCVLSQAAAAQIREQLNGDWTAENGRPWTVAGSGEAITLTETLQGGHKVAYQGTFRLGKIDATHAIKHVDDMGQDLPADVRQQLVGMGISFTLKLETCRDLAKLTGRWGSQNVTYSASPGHKVSSVHDPYDVAVALLRKPKDYRIARLDIGTKGLEQKRSELQAEVRLAEDDQRRAREELARLEGGWSSYQSRTGTAYRAFLDAKARYEEATARLDGYAPGEGEKPPAYKALEQRRVGLACRVNRLYDAIMASKGMVIADAAFDNYHRLQAELDALDAEIVRQRQALGFDDAKARLSKAAEDAFVAQLRAQMQLDGAAIAQDLQRGRIDQASLALSQATAKLSEKEQALAGFNAGAFRMGGAEAEEGATMRWKVEAWDPSEVLAFLDSEIASLGAVLAKADARRRDARTEFLVAQEEASYRQLRLADGIMHSAVAQGVTETVFNAADVIEKTVEAGPIGALGEGAKKMTEALLLGPPSFYEPSIAPEMITGEGGPFSDIRANLKDALKYTAKRGAKSVVSGPAFGDIVKQYILARDTRVYMQAINQAVQGSMETGYRIVGQTEGQAAAKAFEALTKAQDGMKKAVEQGLFRNFAGISRMGFWEGFKKVATSPQAGKLAHSVGRDLAKMATKKALAEWLEGVPLAEYLAAEMEARLKTEIFLAASGVYWEAYDPYHERVAHRREILRQYDPRNQMKIVKDERFPDGADLLIVLRDAAGKPISAPDHNVTVKLGGKSAERLGHDQLFYRVTAADLTKDADGGVVLEVSVDD